MNNLLPAHLSVFHRTLNGLRDRSSFVLINEGCAYLTLNILRLFFKIIWWKGHIITIEERALCTAPVLCISSARSNRYEVGYFPMYNKSRRVWYMFILRRRRHHRAHAVLFSSSLSALLNATQRNALSWVVHHQVRRSSSWETTRPFTYWNSWVHNNKDDYCDEVAAVE